MLMWLELHSEFSYMPAWRGQENIYLFQIQFYYLILVYGVLILPIAVLGNNPFSNESHDRMIGHRKVEEIRKEGVTYLAKQKPGTSRD